MGVPAVEYFFNKIPSWKLKVCHFKNETPAQVLSCEFCKTFIKTYFVEHFEQLLLDWHNVTIRGSRKVGIRESGYYANLAAESVVKLLEKWMFEKKTSETFVHRDFSKTSRQIGIFATLIACWVLLHNNKYVYIDGSYSLNNVLVRSSYPVSIQLMM